MKKKKNERLKKIKLRNLKRVRTWVRNTDSDGKPCIYIFELQKMLFSKLRILD